MPIWFTLVLFAASLVLGELLRQKPNLKDAKPAGLGDFRFPTATEARKIPLLWGTVQIRGPNVTWYGDLLQEAITERVKTGLWSSETFIKGWRYYMGMQFALCEGEVDGLRRKWIKDTLVVDATGALIEHDDTFTIDEPDLFGGDDLGSGGFMGTFRFFAGTDDQAVSSYLAPFINYNGHTPAYRHTCYIANDTEHAYMGNSTSIDAPRFELVRVANDTANLLELADPFVNDLDANPANVLYEVCTNQDWGAKIPLSDMDTDSFTAAAATLKAEGNGFSFMLDGEEQIGDMVKRLETQIDGIVYRHPETKLWTLKLARDDFDLETVPVFSDGSDGGESNVLEVERYTRGTYEGTTNIVSIEWTDRDDEYKTTFATAQNDANIGIQDGNIIYGGDRYPGIKNGTLADSIAWRDLRTVSAALAQARVTTTRATFEVQPLDVVLLSVAGRDFAVQELPMRVKSIDRGSLLEGRITYELVEDVFRAGDGGYGPPPSTDWVPPEIGHVPFPADHQVAFESPRGLNRRSPAGIASDNLVYTGARQTGSAAAYDIAARASSGSPSGTFDVVGTVYAFALIGELTSSLSIGDPVPTSFSINGNPDVQTTVVAAFPPAAGDVPTPEEVGQDLLGLILVGDEFMLVTQAATGTGITVVLSGVYRGALDSVQGEHASGTKVYMLFTGSGGSEESFNPTYNVEIKLLPRSWTGGTEEVDATAIAFTMDHRSIRPYAPSLMRLNGTAWATTVSLEAGGSAEADGIPLEWNRRSFLVENEVDSLLYDAEELDPLYPVSNNTVHYLDVIDDPDGSPTTILSNVPLGSTDSFEVPRVLILLANGGVLPTRLGFRIRSSHTYSTTNYTSRYDLAWDFDVTSALTGDFNFGALDTGVDSNVYTATVTGTYSFVLSSAFSAGDVRYRLDGGSWNVLIGAGTTSGNIASVTAGQTIEVEHLSGDSGAMKLLTMSAAGAGQDGYGVLYT